MRHSSGPPRLLNAAYRSHTHCADLSGAFLALTVTPQCAFTNTHLDALYQLHLGKASVCFLHTAPARPVRISNTHLDTPPINQHRFLKAFVGLFSMPR
jgi:hypothetical protein